MEAFKIISSHRRDDFSIVLKIENPVSRELEDKYYSDIRMGLHWPTAASSACFVIIAQGYPVSGTQGRRELIAEYVSESIGMNGFYRQIIHYAQELYCTRLYAILPENRSECGYLQDLEEYSWRKECSLSIDESLVDNFFLSVSRIRDSMDNGNLVIPDNSVAYEQLNRIVREDLQDNPDERFHYIDALGHVLDGFYRHPPVNQPYINRPNAPY